jgi:tRNA-dihydrouridine synthase C
MDWLVKGKPAVIMAPMEGVTDYPMRTLLSEIPGFTHSVAEFMRISINIPPDRIFIEHMPEFKNQCRTLSGLPVIFQLLGGDEEMLAKAAVQAVNLGAKGIDLNFGCPAATVNRHDGGATLLKYPKRIYSIVKAVREAVDPKVSVSAKFRLGWDTHDPIYENAEMATLAGASWITIHGRTKVDGYKPPAYWGPIGKLNRTLPIPVVANGDIWTLDDFKRCQDETACDHYMLGRGAVVNPYLPLEVSKSLLIQNEERINRYPYSHFFYRLIELSLEETHHVDYPLCRVKQWAKMINLRSPFDFYEKVKVLKNLEDLRILLDQEGH